jgi:hypothetical protein
MITIILGTRPETIDAGSNILAGTEIFRHPMNIISSPDSPGYSFGQARGADEETLAIPEVII